MPFACCNDMWQIATPLLLKLAIVSYGLCMQTTETVQTL